WIRRDVVPAEAQTFADEIDNAIIAGDAAICDQLTGAFQGRVAEQIQATLAAAHADEKVRRQLSAQLGTTRVLEDVRDLNEILKARDALALIAERLPGHIRNLADAQLDATKALLEQPAIRRDGLLPYALILVMSRLAAPWQLIRIATKAAVSDDTARVAA